MSWDALVNELVLGFGPAGGLVIAGLGFAWWLERGERKDATREARDIHAATSTALQGQEASNRLIADALKDLTSEVRNLR